MVHEDSGRPLISAIGAIMIASALFLLPLFFGGTEAGFFYPYAAVVLFLSSLSLFASGFSSAVHQRHSTSFMVLAALVFFALFCGIQYVWTASQVSPHPVLGHSVFLGDREAFGDAFLRILFFIGVFVLSDRWLRAGGDSREDAINRWIVLGGVMLASIGVIHWFYDNGRLFWTFTPLSEGAGDRARWPFVNPNHLGNILLLSLFPSTVLLRNMLMNFHSRFSWEISKKGARTVEVLGLRSVQMDMVRCGFAGLTVLIIALAILATLSRGSWMGAVFGAGFLYAAGILIPHGVDNSVLHTETDPHARGRRRRRSPARKSYSALAPLRRLIVPLTLAGVFLFLLQGRGLELVEGRIEYGLLYSKSDIRWQLYSDSLEMIIRHPFLGVGAGNWAVNYPAFMNPLLSGIDPVYLHSDPLQLLAEFGILGTLPVLFILGLFTFRIISVIRNSSNADRKLRILGTSAGILALCAASFVEFPFRIPAISALVAVQLALIAWEIDRSSEDSPAER